MHTYNCLHPWTGLNIAFNGNVKVDCCYYRYNAFRWDPDGPLDIRSAWNNDWFQRLREIFLRDSLEGTGCHGCPEIYTMEEPPLANLDGFNAAQKANYELAIESYRAGSPTTESLPSYYFLDFGRRCNLNCIMCTQNDARKSEARDQLSCDALMAQADVLSKALEFKLIGGEPLAIPECRKFIEHLTTDDRLMDVRMRMITNGQFLDEFLPMFENRDKISLSISLDSSGDCYEKIRLGGKWDKVSSNIDQLLESRERLGRQWDVAVTGVLMKTSIGGLPEFVTWCLERGLAPNFQYLFHTRKTATEDVLTYPELLEEVPGWREKIQSAIEICQSHGEDFVGERLEIYLGAAEAAWERRGKDVAQAASLGQQLNAEDFHGKRVAIWGTGSNYRICLAKWLADNLNAIDFVGFVDNDPFRWGESVDGHTVLAPGDLSELDGLDVILIASAHRKEIAEQIRSLGMTDVKIV